MTTKFKAQASRLSKHLADKFGLKLAHAASLEAIARCHGMRDWNELAAHGVQELSTPLAHAAGATKQSSLVAQVADEASCRDRLPSPSQFEVNSRDVFEVLRYAQSRGMTDVHVRPDGWAVGRLHGQQIPILETTADLRFRWLGQLKAPNQVLSGEMVNWKVKSVFERETVEYSCISTPAPGGVYLMIRPPAQGKFSSLSDLGITDHARLEKGLREFSGLFLVAGATGSGKSTTLAVMADYLQQQGRQVHRLAYDDWVDFYGKLPPDLAAAHLVTKFPWAQVFLVDELRDHETAAWAMALVTAGRTVLTSIHASTFKGSVLRLRDLNVSEKTVKACLRVAVIQTLMRTRCPHCQGAGCAFCQNRGAGGVTAVSQVALLHAPVDVQVWCQAPNARGTLADDALTKLEAGLVSGNEMVRCFGVPKRWH